MANTPRSHRSFAGRVIAAILLAIILLLAAMAGLLWLSYRAISASLAGQPAGEAIWRATQNIALIELARTWPLAVGLLLAWLLILWLLARWAVAPLRQLARTTLALGSAPPDQVLPVRGASELVQIAQGFNQRSENMLAATRRLEAHNRELNDTTRRLDALLRISHEIGAMLDAERSLRRVATLLCAIFGYERAAAALVDGETLLYFFSDRANSEGLEPPVRAPFSERSLAGRAVLRGQVLRVDDLRADPSLAAAPGMPAARAELAAPVVGNTALPAVLLVQSSRPAAFSSRDEADLAAIAAQLAVVLANSGRFRGEQVRRQLAEATHRVSQTLSAALAPDSVSDLILDQLGQALPSDRSALLLLDGEYIELKGARGLANGSGPLRLRLRLSELPLVAHIVAQNRAVVLPDAQQNPGYRPLPGALAARGWLGVPLVHQGRVGGALLLESDQPGRYDDDDAQAIVAMAGQAAIVLENTRLSARAQELSRQLEVVSSVNQLVNTRDLSRGLPGVLRTIIHQIRLVVPCDRAAVALLNSDDGSFTLEIVHDFAMRDWAELPTPQRIAAERTPWQSACNNQGPVEQPDLARSAFEYDQQLAAHGLKSGVVVPITGGDQAIGALGFASRQAGVYGPAQVNTLLEIARQLGTMLHKERLAREREEAAIELARSREHLNMVDKVRLVGQLASGVAHDFNNLLAGILGNAQLLLLEVQDEEQREMLKVIERAAKDGTETVRRIQGFARVSPDEQLIEVRLDLLARDAIDITRPRWRDVAQSRGAAIEIMRDIQPVRSILGRSGELREVLSNLIINAADAMPRGGTLTVTTYEAGGTGDEPPVVAVSVADTGTGIPPEVRNRIFEPFFTTKGEKGTGLGLAVSLGIVQSHGGAIDVESSVGVGTRFTVRLPLRTPDDLDNPTQRIPRATRQHQITRPGNVLFVESEAMIRVPMARILNYWGHRVTQASGGHEALQKFSNDTYDVVISDLGMPDMSGWELLAQVKQRDPRVVTVLLTGWGGQSVDDERRQAADFLLEKPFDQDDLRAVIAEALSDSQ